MNRRASPRCNIRDAAVRWLALAIISHGVIAEDARRSRAAHALRLAVGRTGRRLRQQAGGEVTPSQAAALDALAKHGSLTPSKLAEVERLSRPTITRLVVQLKRRGLVECTPDPNDRRSYRIAISE